MNWRGGFEAVGMAVLAMAIGCAAAACYYGAGAALVALGVSIDGTFLSLFAATILGLVFWAGAKGNL